MAGIFYIGLFIGLYGFHEMIFGMDDHYTKPFENIKKGRLKIIIGIVIMLLIIINNSI